MRLQRITGYGQTGDIEGLWAR